jgi:hypothetical protein
MLHIFESILAALTEKQTDDLIKHLGTFVAAFSSLVSLLGVCFLIWRQSKNKTDLAAKIDDNTAKTEAGIAKSEEALTVANGTNAKIAVATELAQKAMEAAATKQADGK